MESESSPKKPAGWSPQTVALVILFLLQLALLVVSVAEPKHAEPLFIHTTYYLLLVTVLCWAASYLYLAREVRKATVVEWVKENKGGIIIALAVTLIAYLAIQPALRVLADETNLLGTSRSFFANKTATFTTTGKYYYDNFWDQGVVIDRRPSLFPFLVSLVHIVRGYTYKNVFLFNMLVLPVFVLVSYRVAKGLGGEIFGLVAAILVVAHPITLISQRSGGFDFFMTFLALLVIKAFVDHCRNPSAERLLVLWMNLCVFAEVRYETALFLPPVVALVLIFKLAKLEYVRPFGLLYALGPVYLLPRIWQAILRGSVPEQDPGTITFSLKNFFENSGAYFKPLFNPFDFHPPHSSLVIALGLVGCVLWYLAMSRRMTARDWQAPQLKVAAMVGGWAVMTIVIVFTYFWGKPQHPAASRLVISIDTFFSFPAAWALTVLLKRFRPFVTVLVASAIFAIYVPVASQYRILNELTLTREAATNWRFFESLQEKRIMIITERPGLFTVMDYGSVDFETARNDPSILESLNRKLYYDIYLVQVIDLTTNQPLPQYRIWPERQAIPMIEFQNDANATVRISRLARQ
jgi:4-amino-4-deoxy-L-arabinose transferase-like glycosyltransferase